MAIPTRYSFSRYLAAKKSVDDRALNRHVWRKLVRALPPVTPKAPLRVLEVGAGIGTMVERALDWGLLTHANYTAIDAESKGIAQAQRRLPRWAGDEGFDVSVGDEGRIRLRGKGQDVVVALKIDDLFDFVARETSHRAWDLLMAHAFLDLVDVPSALPLLFSLLRPGGLFYFTLVFDGTTLFEPPIDPELDGHIERLYHQTMDRRLVAGKPSGDSKTGRHLFAQLRAAGAELLDAGSSDWVVFPRPDGYPADEAYFLHFIVHTIHAALQGHPNLDGSRFADWVAQRHRQVEQGNLVYIAHQLDFVGRLPAASG